MTVLVRGSNFGLVHRRLINALLREGIRVPTDYDKKGEGEEDSLDLSVVVEVFKPWDPPIFSKCIWGSVESALEYVDEVCEGKEGNIEVLGYTYHDRMVNQWPGMLAELGRNEVTRRAQCITWRVEEDLGAEYPPCLQRIWLRVVEGKLDMHTHWRSRDALKAWGLNAFAFAHLHRRWAERVSEGRIGVYREFIDSCHIYGKDVWMAKQLLVNRPDWQYSLEEMYDITR